MGSLANNVVAVAAVLAALVAGGSCGPPKFPSGPNITTNYNGQWLTARATWYGQPNGAGPADNGGACGIKDVLRQRPHLQRRQGLRLMLRGTTYVDLPYLRSIVD